MNLFSTRRQKSITRTVAGRLLPLPLGTLVLIGLAIVSPLVVADDAPKREADGKTLESARADLLGKWKKVHSLTATIKSKTYIEYDDGYTDITGVGRYEFLKKNGKEHVRTQIKLEVVNRKEQQVHTDRKEITTYDDGSILYTVRDEGEEQFASKDVVTSRSAMDATWVFDTMSKYYTLKRLPDVHVEGEVAYVIQGTSRDAEAPSTQVAIYLHKANAALVKYEVYNENGRVVSTVTYSGVTLNPKLKLERFVFTPSADLVVEDHTVEPAKTEDAKSAPDQQ